jgi:hypothetical protein
MDVTPRDSVHSQPADDGQRRQLTCWLTRVLLASVVQEWLVRVPIDEPGAQTATPDSDFYKSYESLRLMPVPVLLPLLLVRPNPNLSRIGAIWCISWVIRILSTELIIRVSLMNDLANSTMHPFNATTLSPDFHGIAQKSASAEGHT